MVVSSLHKLPAIILCNMIPHEAAGKSEAILERDLAKILPMGFKHPSSMLKGRLDREWQAGHWVG